MLRDLGKADTQLLLATCEQHLATISAEGLRYALKTQPAEVRKDFSARRRAAAAMRQPA